MDIPLDVIECVAQHTTDPTSLGNLAVASRPVSDAIRKYLFQRLRLTERASIRRLVDLVARYPTILTAVKTLYAHLDSRWMTDTIAILTAVSRSSRLETVYLINYSAAQSPLVRTELPSLLSQFPSRAVLQLRYFQPLDVQAITNCLHLELEGSRLEPSPTSQITRIPLRTLTLPCELAPVNFTAILASNIRMESLTHVLFHFSWSSIPSYLGLFNVAPALEVATVYCYGQSF